MANNVMFELQTMTDEDILRECGGKEVYNIGDYDLTGDPKTISGGLFDPAIFGKYKRCVCGFTKSKDSTSPPQVCPHCKTIVFSNQEDFERNSACFRLSTPVIYPYKVEKFWAELSKMNLKPLKPQGFVGSTGTWNAKLILLWNTAYVLEPTTDDSKARVTNSKGDKFELKIEEVDDYTDSRFIGLVGLYNLQDYLVDGVKPDFSQYLNLYIPITSTYFRPIHLGRRGGRNIAELDSKTIMYRSIIEFSKKSTTLRISHLSSSIDYATLAHNLNILVAKAMYSTEMLGGGKWHTVRDNMRTRVKRSGRANIYPALDLDMDHCYIPRPLAYEALNGDIMQELMQYMDASEAKKEIAEQSPKAIQVFNEIVDRSMVILLRNPTLHKYNLMAFHPVINDEPCLIPETPIQLWDGRILTVKEIYDNNLIGEEVPSLDEIGNVVPGTISKVFKVPNNSGVIYDIALENGETIHCTKHHKLMLKDGTYKEAQYLTEEDELMEIQREC